MQQMSHEKSYATNAMRQISCDKCYVTTLLKYIKQIEKYVFNISKCLMDIAAIIDMDGFSVNGKFLCKELGFLKVGDATAQSFFFDIGLRWRDLTPKEVQIRTNPHP
jgi:hypothetical protein